MKRFMLERSLGNIKHLTKIIRQKLGVIIAKKLTPDELSRKQLG